MSIARGRRTGIVVFVTAALLLVLGMHPALSLYDEGIVLVGAERVLHGELPWRDFWTLYAPGQFYVVAWLFELFGVSDLTLRAYGIVVKAAIVLLAWRLMTPYARPAAALAGAVGVLLLLTGAHNYGFPVFPALAFAMAALLLLPGAQRSNTTWWWMAACVAAATLFRQDLGVYAALAIGIGHAAASRGPESALSFSSLARRGLVFASAVALLLSPVALWLLWQVPHDALYEQLLRFPLQAYPAARSLPFPVSFTTPEGHAWFHPVTLARFAVYAPFVVTVWVVLLQFRVPTERAPQDAEGSAAQRIALIAMNLLFTLKGLVRVEPLHMMQSLVLSTVMIVVAGSQLDWRRDALARRLALPALLSGMLLLPSAAFGAWAMLKGAAGFVAGGDSPLSRCLYPALPRLRCASIDRDTLLAVSYLRDHTSPADTIHVGTYRSDRIVANAVALYFVAERRPFTRWHESHPGVQTGLTVQRAMLDDLSRTPPKLVLLTALGDTATEPNESSRSSGVTLFDEALRSRYEEVARFGGNRIFAPRPAQPSP